MTKAKKVSITKISEFVEQKLFGEFFYLAPAKETEKAFAVNGQKFNASANLYDALVYFPKSQCVKVENDYFVNDQVKEYWVVPSWLYNAKTDEGYVF